MLLLLNNVHEKTSHEVKTDKILKACAHAICNLHAWYNFAPVLHESALVFSQSGTRNFFLAYYHATNNILESFLTI